MIATLAATTGLMQTVGGFTAGKEKPQMKYQPLYLADEPPLITGFGPLKNLSQLIKAKQKGITFREQLSSEGYTWQEIVPTVTVIEKQSLESTTESIFTPLAPLAIQSPAEPQRVVPQSQTEFSMAVLIIMVGLLLLDL